MAHDGSQRYIDSEAGNKDLSSEARGQCCLCFETCLDRAVEE